MSHTSKTKHKGGGIIPPLPAGTAVATPAEAGVLPKLAVPAVAAAAAAAVNGSNSARERDREREKDREQQQQQQQRSDGSTSTLSTHDLPPVKPPATVHDATLFPKLGPGRADSSSLPLPLSARERERERDRALALEKEKEKERERNRNLSSGDASPIAAAAGGAAAAAPPALTSKISLPSVSPRTHHESAAAAAAAATAQRIASRVGSINDPTLDALLRREPSAGPTSARSDKDAAELQRARSEKKKKNSESGGSGKRSKESSNSGGSKPTTRARAASEASANSVVPALTTGFGTAQRIDHTVPAITPSPRPSASDSADEAQQQQDEEDAYEDEDAFCSPTPEPAASAAATAAPATTAAPLAIVPPLATASAVAASSSPSAASTATSSPAATARRKVGPSVQQAHQLTARCTQDGRDYEPVSEDIEGVSAHPSAAPTPKHAAAAPAAATPAVSVAAAGSSASSPQTSPRARRNGGVGAKKSTAASPAATGKAGGAGGSAKANKKKPAAPGAAAPATAAAAPAKASATVSAKPAAAAASTSVGKKKPAVSVSGSPAASAKSKQSANSASAAAAAPSKDGAPTTPAAAADDDYGDTDWRSDTAKALPEHKESSPSSASPAAVSPLPQPNFRLRAGSEQAAAASHSNSHSSLGSSVLPKQLLRFTLLPETISSFYTSSVSSSPHSPSDFNRSTTLEFLRARDDPDATSSDLESLALGSSGAATAAAVQSAPSCATQWDSVFSTTLSAPSSKAASVFTMDADALQQPAAIPAPASAAVLIQLWDNFYSCADSDDESSPRNNAWERTLLAEFTTTLGAIHAGDGSVIVRAPASTSEAIPSTVRAGDGSFERTVKIASTAESPPHPVVLQSAIKAPRSSADSATDPCKPHNRVRFFHKVEVFTIEPRIEATLQATVQLPQTTMPPARPPSQPKHQHQQSHQRGEEKSNHHSPLAQPSRLKPHPPPQHASPSAPAPHSSTLIDVDSGLDLAALIQPDAQPPAQSKSRRGSSAASGAIPVTAAAAFSSPVAHSKKATAHANNSSAAKSKPSAAGVESPVIPPLFPLGAAAAAVGSGGGSSFVRLSLRGLDFPFAAPVAAASPAKAAISVAAAVSWRFEMLLLHQGCWTRLYSSELSASAQWKTIQVANPAASLRTANKAAAETILDAPLLIRCSSSGAVDSRCEEVQSTAQVVVSLRSLLPDPDALSASLRPLMLQLTAPAPAAPGLRAKNDAVTTSSGPAGAAGRLLVTFLPPSTPAVASAGSSSNASSRRSSGNNGLHVRNK